ncbi:5,10-methylene tetrahydromethanopterin reductase, partial [Pseudomonas sp. SIMBA_067]
VPELQKRGVYKTEYAQGTLREKLFGEGARLAPNHPGAGYRDLSGLYKPRVGGGLLPIAVGQQQIVT